MWLLKKLAYTFPAAPAPLFSTVLMLGVPAKLAGCKEIILCTPPDANGKIPDVILFAAKAVGITKVFRVGGVQAIAAMTYGTRIHTKGFQNIRPRQSVCELCQTIGAARRGAIDMPAGPSEVAILADSSANAAFVAADLLSQAEHGADSQVILVSDSEELVRKVQAELDKQAAALPRKDIIAQALHNSKMVITRNAAEAIELLNEYAPEHLILSCENASDFAEKIVNAGSVFLGHYSPESVGDYASGTNHTLPTNGYARMYSGVSVDSFVKKITFQQLSAAGLKNISNTVIMMAEAEGLQAHAEAVKIRLRENN